MQPEGGSKRRGRHARERAGATDAAPATTPTMARPQHPPATPARRRGTLAGGALVALLAAGGGFALGAALSADDPPPPRRPAVPHTPAAVSLHPYATSAFTAGVPRTWSSSTTTSAHGGFGRAPARP